MGSITIKGNFRSSPLLHTNPPPLSRSETEQYYLRIDGVNFRDLQYYSPPLTSPASNMTEDQRQEVERAHAHQVMHGENLGI